MSYPLTTVVKKILDAAYSGSKDAEILAGNSTEVQTFKNNSTSGATKRFVVFSYLRDFEFLWGLHQGRGLNEIVEKVITASYRQNPQTGKHIVNELTLIMVWDGMPESDGTPMNVGGYVTPFDWAVMFSCYLFRVANDSLNKDKPKPKVRLLILDLKSHEYGTSFGVKAFQALHGQFPWIQAYRPVGKQSYKSLAMITSGDEFAHTRAAFPLDVFGLEHFIQDVLHTDRILFTYHEFDDVDRQNNLEIAVGLWGNYLVKPGDRHTVANLIGPLILAQGFSSKDLRDRIVKAITEGSPLRNALAQLVYATGLVSPVIVQGGSLSGLLQAGKPGKLGRSNNLKFILIDDQYASGFHHVLTGLIFGDKYNPNEAPRNIEPWERGFPNCGSIKCYCQVEALLNILSQSPAITDWDTPRKLNLPDNGDILLLDLRLWLEDDQKQGFFDALKNVCTHLDVKALCRKDSSFKHAFEAVNGKEPNETAALVLLPLLLSYYDPSLPIVLFSSTHQRAVIEMVAHRPNIFTDFSKPLLGNYVQITEAGDFLKDLRVALEKAIQLHEARIIWERIVNLEAKAPEFYIAGVNNTIKSTYNSPSLNVDNAIDYPLIPEVIRKQLGYYFQHYILLEAYYDFVAIPWEFIEGSLTNGLAEAKAKENRFDVTRIKNKTLAGFPKNGGGLLLKQLRHKKAHGDLTDLLSSLQSKDENWRCFSILEFAVFIDFLEQAVDTLESPCKSPKKLSETKDAPVVNGNILEYSLTLIEAIWGSSPSQSFSQETKAIVQALRA